MREFADDDLNMTIFDWVENIVENGENAGYQHLLYIPQLFQRSFRVNLRLCGKEL